MASKKQQGFVTLATLLAFGIGGGVLYWLYRKTKSDKVKASTGGPTASSVARPTKARPRPAEEEVLMEDSIDLGTSSSKAHKTRPKKAEQKLGKWVAKAIDDSTGSTVAAKWHDMSVGEAPPVVKQIIEMVWPQSTPEGMEDLIVFLPDNLAVASKTFMVKTPNNYYIFVNAGIDK